MVIWRGTFCESSAMKMCHSKDCPAVVKQEGSLAFEGFTMLQKPRLVHKNASSQGLHADLVKQYPLDGNQSRAATMCA